MFATIQGRIFQFFIKKYKDIDIQKGAWGSVLVKALR